MSEMLTLCFETPEGHRLARLLVADLVLQQKTMRLLTDNYPHYYIASESITRDEQGCVVFYMDELVGAEKTDNGTQSSLESLNNKF